MAVDVVAGSAPAAWSFPTGDRACPPSFAISRPRGAGRAGATPPLRKRPAAEVPGASLRRRAA
eukprot:3339645-Alexandrium_andersonii.AAC.1